MNTAERNLKFNAKEALDAVRRFVSSPYFALATAAVTLLCYYLAWDMVTIWYMALCGTFVLLFMDDAAPLITIFLFMNIMISMEHTPTLLSDNPDDYFFRTDVLAQIGVAIGIFAVSGVYRLVRDVMRGNFKPAPTFFGLCLFGAAILFNGMFSRGYTPMSMLYGFFLAFLFLGVFTICSGAVKVGDNIIGRIAWPFIVLSFCLVIELIVAYATYDNLWLESGGVDRTKLYFGWGMYNTIGMLYTISMPAAAYFANKCKRGYLFTIYLAVLLFCDFLTMSRQSMLCGTLVFAICLIWIFRKKEDRRINLMIVLLMIAAALVFVAFNTERVWEVIKMLFENFFYGSGRSELYDEALEAFIANPLFGTGFYRDLEIDPGFIGLPIMPDMYHCTIFELIAVGGIVALVPYVIHRVQTVISFIKNPTEDRFYIALTLFALLIMSLLDNHIFYILPTLVYSFLTAMLIKTEAVPGR